MSERWNVQFCVPTNGKGKDAALDDGNFRVVRLLTFLLTRHDSQDTASFRSATRKPTLSSLG